LDARVTDIVKEIQKILKKRGMYLKCYRCIFSKLCHVLLILPGTKGLFSPINYGLKGEPFVVALRKSSKMWAGLLDLVTMVTLLASWPTFVNKLIPNEDHY
jgi:hypothetical protein